MDACIDGPFPPEVEEARIILEKNAEPDKLKKFLKFVPGAQNALAVKTPVIDRIVKIIWSKYSDKPEKIIELSRSFWRTGCYYEERKIAIRLLGKVVRKQDPKEIIKIVNHWADEIHTWDLCDQLGIYCTGDCLASFFKEVIIHVQEWSEDDREWIRRLSTASLTKLRNTDLGSEQWNEISKILDNSWNDDRYYVRKGLSWSLRELSKNNSAQVIGYLKKKLASGELTRSHGLTFLKDSTKNLYPNQREKLLKLYSY
ncbi:MAG: DNA alkylation repair protein [Candidatus Odinarchaeota archaeon]